jgi:hypothetical protein
MFAIALWWVTKINILDYVNDTSKIYVQGNKNNYINDYLFFGNQNLMIYTMKNFVNDCFDTSRFINNNENPEFNFIQERQFAFFIYNDENTKNNVELVTYFKNDPNYKSLHARPFSIKYYLSGYHVGYLYDVINVQRNLPSKTNS